MLTDDKSSDYKPPEDVVAGSFQESNYDINIRGSTTTTTKTTSDNIIGLPNQQDVTITNIMILSYHNLVSSGVDCYDPGPSFFKGQYLSSCLGTRIQQNGHLSIPDRQKLLDMLSTWKETKHNRNCLIVCALHSDQQEGPSCDKSRGSRCFSTGWTMSYGEGLRYGHEKDVENQYDVVNKGEGRLQYVVVGSMNKRTMSNLDNCEIGSKLYQDALLVAALDDEQDYDQEVSQYRKKVLDEEWLLYGHLATLHSLSKPDEAGFLIVSCGQYLDTPPITSPNSKSKLLERVSSLIIEPPTIQYHTTYIAPYYITSTLPKLINSDQSCCDKIQLVVGPIIGAVTSTTVNILCEYYVHLVDVDQYNQQDVYAIVRLIDQVTGIEHVSKQDVTSCRATVFSFSDLHENRSYVVEALLPRLHNNLLISRSEESSNSRLGSFTTPATIPPYILASEWQQQTITRMRGRSLKPVVDQVTSLAITDVSNKMISSLLVDCAKAFAEGKFDELKASYQHESAEVEDDDNGDEDVERNVTLFDDDENDNVDDQEVVVVSSRRSSEKKSRPASGNVSRPVSGKKSKVSSAKSRRSSEVKSRRSSEVRSRRASDVRSRRSSDVRSRRASDVRSKNQRKQSALTAASFTTELTKQLEQEKHEIQDLKFLAHQFLIQQLSSRRVMVVGPNQPSWRKHLKEGVFSGDQDGFTQEEDVDNNKRIETSENVDDNDVDGDKKQERKTSTYDNDLASLVNGDAICRSIGNMLQEAWSGVDLVIHCGGSVDLSMTLEDALSTLARAEVLHGLKSPWKEKEYLRLLSLAEEQLRDSYRWHWSNLQSSISMGHGSHLFCCSSVLVDLLIATHYTSIGNLINDYSKVRLFLVVVDLLSYSCVVFAYSFVLRK